MRDHYDRGPARRDRDDRPSYNNRDSDRGEREMFPAVCDECGKDCMVPFRPSGNKPIFCSNCFEKQQDGERGERSERRDFGRDRDERPSYRREERAPVADTSNIQRQLDDINNKLYKIMKMLEPKAAPVFNKMEPVKKRAQKAFEEIVAKVEEVTPEATVEKTEEAA
ncbi:MAG: CxxC-x17-CxxC domain-containing protein [Bacteroidota bacterium]|nr:CxxC-x17-CxxC domain-containing protein [Bacteroidota bacterium]